MRESENLHTVKIIILTGSSLRKELNRSETFNLAKMCNPYRGMTPKWAACDNEMAHEVISRPELVCWFWGTNSDYYYYYYSSYYSDC